MRHFEYFMIIMYGGGKCFLHFLTVCVNLLLISQDSFRVTDYWEVSVCLFRCEIGVRGGSRDSELLDFRSSEKMKNATLMETELDPKFYRKAYIPNMTAYVEETYSHDIKFYNLKILPAFYRRASKCGCIYHGH